MGTYRIETTEPGKLWEIWATFTAVSRRAARHVLQGTAWSKERRGKWRLVKLYNRDLRTWCYVTAVSD